MLIQRKQPPRAAEMGEIRTGSGGPARVAPAKGKDGRRALVLAALAFLVYNANLREISSGDCYSARFLPLAIFKGGTLALDPVLETVRQGHQDAYWIISVGGRNVSLFPIVAPVLATPLYIPAAIALGRVGWREPYISATAEVMEKGAASLIASISVAFVYLFARRRLDPGRAALLAGAYAFGTSTWMTGSQALWQHGTGEMLLAAALLLVTGPATSRQVLLLGAVCGIGVMNRPPDLILFVPLAIEGALRAGRRAPLLVAGAAAAAAPFVAYNLWAFGVPGGGYQYLVLAIGSVGSTHARLRSAPIGPALAGLLFSPAKGLLFFSPFLLFLAGRLWRPGTGDGDRRLSLLVAVGILSQILFYSRTDWRGGYSYGPRYLTDLLPAAVFLLVPLVGRLRRKGLAAFALAAFVGAGFQAVGAFCYPRGLSDHVVFRDQPDGVVMEVWSLSRSPVVVEAQAGLAPMRFAAFARSAVRRLSRTGESVSESSR